MILPLLFCFNLAAHTAPEDSLEWKNLLHYKNHQTSIDSPTFFLSPKGMEDPKAELNASLEAIGGDKKFGKLNLPFECSYPARTKFLKKNFNLTIKQECPQLKEWLKGLNAETVSLIFASYYPNNPASIFGHTFLKINSSPENKISDYAVNYLAITSESNGLMFGIKGLVGSYQGQFSVMPYFLKVNEYNHSESRDIFEYHLDLNPDEIDTLLRHIWEMENNGFFDYYFLDDNCSYFMLRVLDVARPSLKVSTAFSFTVIPAETIKAIHESGSVTKIDYRPSLFTEISHGQERVPEEPDQQIKILQYKKLASKKWSRQDDEIYHELLTKRARNKTPAISIKIEPRSLPHETHAPQALTLGSGMLDSKIFTRVSLRLGVHDLLDREAGYLPFSSVEILKMSFRVFDSSRVFLDQFTLIDVSTLNPHRSWDKKISWKSRVEFRRFDQDFCSSCEVLKLNAGIGKSLELGRTQVISIFANTQIALGEDFDKRWTWGLHPEVSYLLSSSLLRLESSVMLLNRFDEARVLDSIKLHQGLGIELNKAQALKLNANHYQPINDDVKTRSEWLIDWNLYF